MLFDPNDRVDSNGVMEVKEATVETVFAHLKSRGCLRADFDVPIQPTSTACSEALKMASTVNDNFSPMTAYPSLSSACAGASQLALYYHCYAYR